MDYISNNPFFTFNTNGFDLAIERIEPIEKTTDEPFDFAKALTGLDEPTKTTDAEYQFVKNEIFGHKTLKDFFVFTNDSLPDDVYIPSLYEELKVPSSGYATLNELIDIGYSRKNSERRRAYYYKNNVTNKIKAAEPTYIDEDELDDFI